MFRVIITARGGEKSLFLIFPLTKDLLNLNLFLIFFFFPALNPTNLTTSGHVFPEPEYHVSVNSEDHCKETAEKALHAFNLDKQTATVDIPFAETILSGTLLQIRKSFRKSDINRAFVHATFVSPDKIRWSSCLIKMLLGRLSTLAKTQERDLAKWKQNACAIENSKCAIPTRGKRCLMRTWRGGCPSFWGMIHLESSFSLELLTVLPECKRTLTRALLLSVYRGRMGFIWTTGILSSELNCYNFICTYEFMFLCFKDQLWLFTWWFWNRNWS